MNRADAKGTHGRGAEGATRFRRLERTRSPRRRSADAGSAQRTLRSLLWVPVALGVYGSPARVGANTGDRCGPRSVHVESDGRLLVLCEKSGSVVRIDPDAGTVSEPVPLCAGPFDLTRHSDGKRVYVSCRESQEILEVEASDLHVLRRLPLRGDPTGVAVSADGRRLYAAVHSLDQIVVLDLGGGVERARLAAGNGPEYVRLDMRSGRVFVTNLLTNPVSTDQPCRSEITIIDDVSGQVVERVSLENASALRGIDFSPDGTLAIVALTRPKNLVPMVEVARGWVITNGFAALPLSGDGSPTQLLVDLPNRGFADVGAVTFALDGKKVYLASAGGDTVIAIEIEKLRGVIEEARSGAIPRPADHLGLSRRYVTARIGVGADPESLATSGDGRVVYVANRLDDSVSVIDATTDEVVRTIAIDDPPPPDQTLLGERHFHSAARTFQQQFSCVSCHPDRGLDALQYDLEPDGMGENIVDNRNLRGIEGTGPFKWAGTNPDIVTQCGTRTAKWITRTGWLTSVQVVELAAYISSIPPVFNPYQGGEDQLSPAQQRGKRLFERTVDNQGRPLADTERCDFCHSGPHFTDGRKFDVGTKGPRDSGAMFDTAHLTNIFESAPYLHDGRARTLEELWTRFNPDGLHGLSSDWTKQQLNDLVEYLKSL